jgi:uncharacterized coiled-coil protein SlyX
MPDHCKDCAYVQSLEKQVQDLQHKTKDHEARLSGVEKTSAVSEERIDMIFNILKEIKGSIDKIATKIEIMEKKPGQKWDNISEKVVTVAITAIVTFIMSKFF